MAPLHEDYPARLAVAYTLLLLLTAWPGLAAEPQKAPPAEGTPVPPVALSTPVPSPHSRDKGVVSKTKRLNLWPFLYYRHDPVGDTYQFNLIGPMLRFGGTPEEETFALSPLLFSRKDKKTGDSVTEFLWPYGHFKSEGGETETRLLPFLEGDKDESPSFGIFPIYGGRSSKGEGYGGIFPIFGTIKERFGQDEGSFFLFPLFVRSRRDDTTTTHLLWPFFSSTLGPSEDGFKAWPFFGWRNEAGRMESSFVLWPFWIERRRGLDTDNPEHFRMFFPFFGRTTSPKRDSWVALWPFFHSAKDKEHGYSTFSLFPLLTVTRGADREGFKLLPLFGYEKTKRSRSFFIVTPFIYGARDLQAGGYREKRTRWLFFAKDRQRTWDKDGATSRLTHVWPIGHYKKSRSGAVNVAFPSVFPIVSESFQRNWPYLTLYDYRRDEVGRVTSSFLWNLFTYEANDHSSSMELAYIFERSSDREAGTKEFSLFKGLLAYRRLPDRTRYSFLYVPWEIKRAGAETPATPTLAAKKPQPTEPHAPKAAERKVKQRITFESIR